MSHGLRKRLEAETTAALFSVPRRESLDIRVSVDTKRNDMIAHVWICGVSGQKKCAQAEISFYLIMGRDKNSAVEQS